MEIKLLYNKKELERRTYILNFLLIGFILLSFLSFGVNLVEWLIGLDNPVSAGILLIFFLFFVGLYILSKRGYFYHSSFLFIFLLLLTAGFLGYKWGVDLTMVILLYIFTIFIAGMLVNTRAALFITVIASGTLIFINRLHQLRTINVDRTWRTEELWSISDVIVFSTFLFIISLISWLSNREIERALKRAKKSEDNLRKERDMLEVNVAEKTKQLQLVWEKKRVNLQEFASIGRHTVGVIHDLVTPLTTLSLNLKMFKNINHSRLISKATQASEQIEQYIERTRKRIDNKDAQTYFSISKEISRAKKSVAGKARSARVKITLPKTNLDAFGNPFSFYQLTLNLLDNAIDSYAGSQSKKREVLVDIKQNKQNVFLTVTDYGQGIAFRDLKRIFDPFFTTKGSAGKMGIGLTICKEIVEKDFGGTISVKSKLNQGTIFVIKLPILKKKN